MRPFPCHFIRWRANSVGTHPYVLFEEDNFSNMTLVSTNCETPYVLFNTESTFILPVRPVPLSLLNTQITLDGRERH